MAKSICVSRFDEVLDHPVYLVRFRGVTRPPFKRRQTFLLPSIVFFPLPPLSFPLLISHSPPPLSLPSLSPFPFPLSSLDPLLFP